VAGFIGSPAMNIIKATVKEDNGRVYSDEGDFRIALSPELADKVRPNLGKDVLFGIRPEDLVMADKAEEGATISAKAEVVEPLGSEILLYVSTTQHPSIIVRVPPHHVFKVGDTVHLKPTMGKIHFFELETEKAIT